jgi:hypothetical protein
VNANGREFGLDIVLAVTHGLPSLAEDYRVLLEYLSGLSLSAPTGVVGVAESCQEWVLEQHPRLREVPPRPDFHGDARAMDAWAAEQAVRLGAERLVLRPLPVERRDFPPVLDRVLDVVESSGPLSKVFVRDPRGLGSS